MPGAIEANVTINPGPLAPLKGEWTVDTEAKTSTAHILGGTLVVFRREDNKLFAATFTLDLPAKGEGDDATPEGAVTQRIRLDEAQNLTIAQATAETLVRQMLSTSHPELHAEQAAIETQAAQDAAGPDPF